MHQLTQLDNGLTVATAEMPSMASVCLGIWVGIGSRHEHPAQNGAAHFIEHMLFKGTGSRNARQIVAEVEGLGGYLNAYTSEDHTCYYGRGRANHWRHLLNVLWDMYRDSRFPAVEVRREREVIKEERAMYLDDPSQQVQELLGEVMWPHHPLGHPIEGTEEALDRLGRNELMHFLHARYGPQNTCVVAVGNISHQPIVKAVRRLSRAWQAQPDTSFAPAVDNQDAPRTRTITRDIEQTQLAIGIKTCSRDDRRRHAVRLLNTLLGENMSARLYQVLREQHGLAYSVYSTPGYYEDTGDLTIGAGVDSQSLPKVFKLIKRELRRLKSKAPSTDELRQAKQYVLGQFDLHLENTENHMTWLGECVLGRRDVVNPDAIKRRLRAVSADQIQRVAIDFLQPERMSVAMVSPSDEPVDFPV
ncbi:MAG: peptidase M16 [Verrucomicrobiales bacterium]|nr:peptidase M16 [Verrucomicrobiales bacterium]|tara:strand:+ start:2266 stop:3516 length:1251 start_codon:yes stop_codon:yes gene_type:complete